MAEDKPRFMGTYFEVEKVIGLSKAVGVLSWIVAAIYALDTIVGLGTMALQYARGFMVGMGVTDLLQQSLFVLERPLRAILYFAVLQAISKGLLVLLDMEENTRRATRGR
jgi:hypothetical protein